MIGYSYSDLKKPTEAVGSYNQALEIFREKQDESGQLHAVRSLGDAYSSMEGDANKQEAARYYDEATSGYERNRAFEEVGQVQLKVAELYEDSDNKADREKMIAAYQRAIAAYEQARKSELAASTLATLGDTYVTNADDPFDTPVDADTEKAEGAYRQAVDIYKSKNDTENAAKTLIRIARLFDDSEDPDKRDKSYKAYTDAAKIYEGANQHKEAANTFNRLGIIQRQQQRLDLAHGTFEKAASAFERAGDLSGQAKTLRAIAAINNCRTCDNTRKRRAADLHRQAIALYERMSKLSGADRTNQRSSLRSIISIYKALGEKQLADEYVRKLDALTKDPE